MMEKKYTPEVLDAIASKIEAGMTRKQIAAELNTSEASLQVTCCRAGISLRRKSWKRRISQPSERKRLTVAADTIAALRNEALRYGISEANLAGRLLELIVQDNLFDAVLDEA